MTSIELPFIFRYSTVGTIGQLLSLAIIYLRKLLCQLELDFAVMNMEIFS